MDFINGLPSPVNKIKESYDSIPVIIDWLIKMVYYELIMNIIDALRIAEVILV